VWSKLIPVNSEKLVITLNSPHYTEHITSNLNSDFEFQQHLGSLKYMINITIWIRDTGCYTTPYEDLHPSNSPPPGLIAPVPSPSWAEAPPPSRRLLATVQALVNVGTEPWRALLCFPHLVMSRRGPYRPGAGAPVSHHRRLCSVSTVDRACAGPWTMDSVHAVSYWKINLKPENPHHFAERPLGFFVIKPQSMNFQEDLLIFKNNSKYSPSHFPEIPNRSL
jgi:hypothetical protein